MRSIFEMRGSSDPSQEKTIRSSTESNWILQLRQGIIRFMQEQAARKTITRRRKTSPSTARKRTGRDSGGPDPAKFSAHPGLRRACIHFV
jgi:hypothetical protein